MLGSLLAAVGTAQYLEAVIPVGAMPLDVLWNPTSNKVYTANFRDNTVTILSGSANQVVATVPVAPEPVNLYWNSVANKVYVLCSESNRLEVIDGRGDTIVARLQIPYHPAQVAFNASLNRLYVGCADDGRVLVIDGASDTIMRRFPLTRFGPPTMLWHPITNRLLCATSVDSVYTVVCSTEEIVARTSVMHGAWSYWCYNPVNKLAYLGGCPGTYVFTSCGDSIVAYVDGYSMGFDVVPFDNKIYLQYWRTREGLAALDCNTHAVTELRGIYAGPLVCDTRKGKVYVGHAQSSDSLGVIDARADTLIKLIPCPGSRTSACWNQTDSRVYFADKSASVLYVIRDTSAGVLDAPQTGTSREVQSTVLANGRLFWNEDDVGLVIDIAGRRRAVVSPGPNNLVSLPVGIYAVVGADRRPKVRIVKLR